MKGVCHSYDGEFKDQFTINETSICSLKQQNTGR